MNVFHCKTSVDFSKVPNPCFVIEEDKLRGNLSLIQHVAQESGAEIILAFKGFAWWRVFPIVKEYIHTATASSLNEARLCFEEMKAKAHTYCVAIDDDEFDELASYSSHITFNSLNQWQKFKQKVKKFGISPGIRVNPEYSEVKTMLYNPCSPHSRLGMTSEHFKPENQIMWEGLEGLHFHALCENDSFTFEKTLRAFEEKFGHLIPSMKWVNFGGGHLMTAEWYDVNHLIGVLKDFRHRYPHLKVFLEPGSAFAWETGFLVAKILDIVENNGVKTAILNVSFTDHMPDTLEMPYKPKILGSSQDPFPNAYAYRMGGLSCLSGDFMTEYYFPHELKSGDIIVFHDMIHYTVVKTTMFNGIHHPSLGMWTSSGKFQLHRKFDYQDYKNRMC